VLRCSIIAYQISAARLIGVLEQAARAEAMQTLWLYTNTAERVYARAGWQTVERFQYYSLPTALMRSDLDLK
jgi:hypothetical protein